MTLTKGIAMDAKPNNPHSSQLILDIAQQLVQTRGYNSFSYADVAAALGMTKASLHYHFASKAQLGVSLIDRYTDRFQQELDSISQSGGDAATKLQHYVRIFSQVLGDDRMCLCGMLAAEFVTLPKSMQEALDHFFGSNERWLVSVLEDGQASRELHFNGPAADMAQFLVGSLEGTMLLARSQGGMARFDAAARRLLAGLGI